MRNQQIMLVWYSGFVMHNLFFITMCVPFASIRFQDTKVRTEICKISVIV